MAYYMQGGGDGPLPINWRGVGFGVGRLLPTYVGVYGGPVGPGGMGGPGFPGGPSGPPLSGVQPQEVPSCTGSRIIVHLRNGSMISGSLRQVYPNGTLLLTEALQGHYLGPKLLLGKVEVYRTSFDLLCRYHECGSRMLFPLDAHFEIRV